MFNIFIIYIFIRTGDLSKENDNELKVIIE